MDELGSWFEVIRSLMPQSFEMRLVWECGAIVVSSPRSENMVWLFADELRGRAPGEVVGELRTRLQYANIVGHARVA